MSTSSAKKGRGGNGKMYRMEMQKKGITIPSRPAGIPMKADPVKKLNVDLGGTPVHHPFLKGKPTI